VSHWRGVSHWGGACMYRGGGRRLGVGATRCADIVCLTRRGAVLGEREREREYCRSNPLNCTVTNPPTHIPHPIASSHLHATNALSSLLGFSTSRPPHAGHTRGSLPSARGGKAYCSSARSSASNTWAVDGGWRDGGRALRAHLKRARFERCSG